MTMKDGQVSELVISDFSNIEQRGDLMVTF